LGRDGEAPYRISGGFADQQISETANGHSGDGWQSGDGSVTRNEMVTGRGVATGADLLQTRWLWARRGRKRVVRRWGGNGDGSVDGQVDWKMVERVLEGNGAGGGSFEVAVCLAEALPGVGWLAAIGRAAKNSGGPLALPQ
jgi:hypothetical protein